MSKGRLGEDNDKEISQEERIKSLIEMDSVEFQED